MKKLYKDENLEINISEHLDMGDYPNIADILFCESLIGFKTWAMLAEDPVDIWKQIKKTMDTYIKTAGDEIKDDSECFDKIEKTPLMKAMEETLGTRFVTLDGKDI